MKTLRYLLIVIAMAGYLSAHAQGLAQQPQAQMRSTSVMQGAGSTLPQAAANGIYVTGSTPGTYSPATACGPKRAKMDDDDDDGWEDEDEPSNPGEPQPIGDVMWPMMALACAYALARAFLKYLLYRKKQ